MLPDFPKLKAEVRHLLVIRARQIHERHAVLGLKIPKHTIIEGDRHFTGESDDGAEIELPIGDFRHKIEFKVDDYSNLTLDKVFERFSIAALEVAKQTSKFFLREFEKTVNEVGNAINVNGKLTPEKFLEMFERLQIDFDSTGKPRFPMFIVGSQEVEDAVKKVLLELEQYPYKTRFSNLLDLKREDWRDRESNRKLVD